jgi:Zn-dependent peptidase ImmA (M78 family)/transcriptional regulator with XRE-family HTH domain
MGLEYPERTLQLVFGKQSSGDSLTTRARTSTRKFARSQDHVAVLREGATGRVLTASEAFSSFGMELLIEASDIGVAILPKNQSEPSKTFFERRKLLGFTKKLVASAAKVSVSEVEDCEDEETRSSIRALEKIAQVLGLDERLISSAPGAGGDPDLGIRLKTISGLPFLSRESISYLAEAAWIIRAQFHLAKLLDRPDAIPASIQPDGNYGDALYPAWEHGYYLAEKTREILKIGSETPILSLRELVEGLGIPVILTSLPANVAGATVATNGYRGIVLNASGHNSNPWVRRATLAHELAHLLWDPGEHLMSVRIDEYSSIEDPGRTPAEEFVEARANAFGVNFLAPTKTVERIYRTAPSAEDGLREVMETFGISFTAARFHVWNACGRSFSLSELRTDDRKPTDRWRTAESLTDDYFPLESTARMRRGRFAGLVCLAETENLISTDTAASYLQTSTDKYRESQCDIVDLLGLSHESQ